MYESNRKSVNNVGGGVNARQAEDNLLEKQTNNYGEVDIFPSLQKYKAEHSTANLQKLMVEILEFCRSVYASTQNEDERNVYRSMIQKINNF